MRKVIVLIILVVVVLTGCSKIPYNDYCRFKTIERYKDGVEVVDKDTGYGYFIFNNDRGNGVIPLYDEYGQPYQENGWRDRG